VTQHKQYLWGFNWILWQSEEEFWHLWQPSLFSFFENLKIPTSPLPLLVNSEPTLCGFKCIHIMPEWGRVLALVATILPFFPFLNSFFHFAPENTQWNDRKRLMSYVGPSQYRHKGHKFQTLLHNVRQPIIFKNLCRIWTAVMCVVRRACGLDRNACVRSILCGIIG